MRFVLTNVFVCTFLFLVLLGGVFPGRGNLYPFVKFPMYGYSKTLNEMRRKDRALRLIHKSGKETLLTDSFAVGMTRDTFSRLYVRPLSDVELPVDNSAAENLFLFLDSTFREDEVVTIKFLVEEVDLSGDIPIVVNSKSLEYAREERE